MSASAFVPVIALFIWIVIVALLWSCSSLAHRRFRRANERLLVLHKLRSLTRGDKGVINRSSSDNVRANGDDDDNDNDDLRAADDSHAAVDEAVRDSATSVQDMLLLRSMNRASRLNADRPRQSVTVAFSHLSLRLRTGQLVLSDVSGEFRPGRLCAVMGGSGAGKTTLLNVLSGRAQYGLTSGDVFINGRRDDIARYKKVVGFVPQDDTTIHGELTVLEVLQTSAATRLPADFNEFSRLQLVEQTLKLLGLSDVRFSEVGTETKRSLSGGQRRRLSVGIELVAQPLLLCLDEPTSGLDSSSAMSLVAALHSLAREGLTIAAVIHQPRFEIFEMFDDVLILGKGGQTVFQGAVSECRAYFESLGFVIPSNGNPADFIMDIVTGDLRVADEKRARLAVAAARRRLRNSGADALSSAAIEAAAARLTASDLLAPAMLFECWRARLLDAVAVDAQPAPKAVQRIGGTVSDFLRWLLVCLLFPWALVLIYFNEQKKSSVAPVGDAVGAPAAVVGDDHHDSVLYEAAAAVGGGPDGDHAANGSTTWLRRLKPKVSMYARYGALTGAVGTLGAVGSMLVIWSVFHKPQEVWGDVAGGCVLLTTAFFSAISIVKQWGDAVMGSRRKATFLGNMLIGIAFGPLTLLLPLLNMSQKARAAVTCGGMISSIALTLVLLFGQFEQRSWPTILGATTLFVSFLTLCLAALMRYNQLPHSDRRVVNSLTQTYIFALRGVTQMVRNWQGIVLDLGLNLVSGLFLGLVFYQRAFQGPLLSPFGLDVGKSFECPQVLSDFFPPACALLLVPLDDPLPGEASLSCLAVAMAAVSSSMRVFGAEMNSFRREAGVGLNTGAYYLGKSLAHLPIVLLAPGVFLWAYAGLAGLEGSWWQHYALLVLVYSCAASLAYIVSMLVRRELSQLFGVILLLVFMMFSGANPTLLQLRDNTLLGSLLYYPTFFSFLRFAQEQFYLIEARTLHVGELTLSTLYGFSYDDWTQCWSFLLMFAVCFRVLAFLALVMVETDGTKTASFFALFNRKAE
jgi:ABC-type multidrug transport system ATPase subunit